MTNHLLKFFLFLLVTASIIECKPDSQKQPDIKTEVYFRYLEQSKSLRAEVSFSEHQKNNLKPIAWDNVLFVNLPMKKRQLSSEQIRYHIDMTNEDMKEEYLLKFWNKGSLPSQVNLKPGKVNSFYFKNSTNGAVNQIRQKEISTLFAETVGFPPGNKVTILFSNEKNETGKLQFALPESNQAIQFSEKELTKLPLGNCTAEMILTKVKTNNHQSTIITEFYSAPVDVSVSP